MKHYLLFVFIGLSVVQIHAQYTGGSGKGDGADVFRGTNNGPQIATQLVFTNTPTFVAPNEAFSVQVEIQDALGNLAAFSNEANASVALTIDNNPSAGTLSGTTPVNAMDAIATFNPMSIDNGGFGYTLKASSASFTDALSSAFDVFNLFAGGFGNGDAREQTPLTTPNGDPLVVWRGGAAGNETDWATAANWVGGTLPSSSDNIVIEPNANGFNPVLDQNRTIKAIYFNSADKKVELYNYDLIVTESQFRADANNYFKTTGTGSLKRNVGDSESFVFAVGDTVFNPVTISNNTGSADTFAVRMFNSVFIEGLSGDTVSDPHVQVTWMINKDNPSSNSGNGVNFEFQWNATQELGTMTQYVLNHFNGSIWEIPATAAQDTVPVGQTPAGFRIRKLVVSEYKGDFSPFAIGGSDVVSLPITLASFTAHCLPQGVELKWTTSTEIDNEVFRIHRSKDMIDWIYAGSVKGAGNSSVENSYRLFDDFSTSETVYYRLTQQDFNGSEESFPPVAITCSGNTPKLIRLYPNPAKEQFFLELSGVESPGDATILVRDSRGAEVFHGITPLQSGSQTLSIRTADWPAGLYFLQLQHNGIVWPALKVVVVD